MQGDVYIPLQLQNAGYLMGNHANSWGVTSVLSLAGAGVLAVISSRDLHQSVECLQSQAGLVCSIPRFHRQHGVDVLSLDHPLSCRFFAVGEDGTEPVLAGQASWSYWGVAASCKFVDASRIPMKHSSGGVRWSPENVTRWLGNLAQQRLDGMEADASMTHIWHCTYVHTVLY